MQVRAPVPRPAVLGATFLIVTACGGGGAARARAARTAVPPPAVVQQLQVPENPYRIIYTPPVNLAKPPDTTAHGQKPRS